jgi:large subunit ribosomal protein L18e
MTKRTGPTNPILVELVNELKKKAQEHNCNIWKRIAIDLEKPTRKRRIVNLYKINKYTKNNETIIVPGKVLAVGDLDHKVTIAAFSFSGNAMEKINKLGKAVYISELIRESPKGKGIRIIG